HDALWNDDVWHKNKCIERQDEDGTDKSDADSKPYPVFLKSRDFFFMEPCLDDRRAESGSPHASFSDQDEDKQHDCLRDCVNGQNDRKRKPCQFEQIIVHQRCHLIRNKCDNPNEPKECQCKNQFDIKLLFQVILTSFLLSSLYYHYFHGENRGFFAKAER